jgi:hypothetical protein
MLPLLAKIEEYVSKIRMLPLLAKIEEYVSKIMMLHF